MVILKETPRDWGLVIIVVLLSLGANLPSEWTEWVNFDRRFFLGGLIAVIAVALIKYLKFTLILVIVFLAIGANLPEEVANEFGVDPQISLLGLVALIVMAVTNQFLKLPTGLERSGRSKTAHGAAALFTAILKGRIAVVQSLLSQGVNVNTRTISGKTPLMAAAYKGYGDIIQMLIEAGADINAKDSRGDSALKISVRGGYTRITELLKKSGAAED
ncbi:MAG: ankyrin repeat domain-containing protein [Sulfuricaulis sp.]|uniref:ankyrin repeat domain-containing protein n=1 Tax=Sulfuricaulis sp. TaxID=2003553 RepID=UPI0034A12A5A